MRQHLPSPSGQARCTAAAPHQHDLQCHRHPEIKEVPVEQRVAEPMAFLSQRDRFPAKPLTVTRSSASISLARACFRRARFGHRAALSSRSRKRLSPSPRRAPRRCPSRPCPLAHHDAVDGHADQPGLPHLPRERAASRGTLRGDGELGEDAGDGRVAAQVSEIVFAMAHVGEGKPS
jgi:hypothetical protein